jgi:hypothetical protein
MADVGKEIAELRRKVDDLEQTSRANFGQVAVAIRRTRRQVVENELQRSIHRLAPPVGVIDWEPRGGQPNAPAIADSLLDRLRRGETVADTMGNVAPSFGQTNVLPDPTFEAAPTLHTLGGAYPLGVFDNWYVERTTNSGTTPTDAVTLAYLRTDGDNPYNSGVVQLEAVFGASGNMTYLVRPERGSGVGLVGLDSLPLPFLVAACRVGEFGAASTLTNVTVTVTLQIYNEDTSSVVAESVPVLLSDLISLKPAHTQLVVAIQGTAATFQADTWRWRLKVDMVATGSGGTVRVKIGEPQLHYAYSPDAAPFSPQIARFVPAYVFGDSAVLDPFIQTDQFTIDVNGTLHWNAVGGINDTNLYRSAADTLKTDDAFEANTLALAAPSDVGLGTSADPLRIGAASGANIGMDANEIMARNNGATASLALNADGGRVTVGQNISATTSAADGLLFGGDVTLFRGGTNILATEDNLRLDSGRIRFASTISPAQLTANQNDWNPTNLATANVIRIQTDATPRTITGIVAGADGDELFLHNRNSATAITLSHDATSTAANRFYCPGAVDYSLVGKATVRLIYSGADSRWLVG